MKLMTYNLLNGAVEQFDDVIKVVTANQPDILTINEANSFDTNNNQRLKEFALKTSLPYYHLAKCGDGDDYHVAVFAKKPFISLKEIKPMARAAILVVVDGPLGEIAMVSTHLTPYTEDLRIQEARRIINELKSYTNRIIMGDLNSLSGADGYKADIVKSFNDMQIKKFTANGKLRFDVMNTFYKARFTDTALALSQEKVITAPTSINEQEAHLNMRLDYILVSDNLKNKIQQYTVIKNVLTKKASDHYPVTVVLA
jgi:endonuclease/exonuclease/phosphatase family metal-dependent hydrolase